MDNERLYVLGRMQDEKDGVETVEVQTVSQRPMSPELFDALFS